MGLVFLVDYCGGGLEALPDGFAVLLVYGAVLLPLLVQLLELAERLNYVGVLCELLRSLAELLLYLKVLLEVKVAELVVDLYHIVELDYVVLVGVVDVAEVGGGNGADLFPAGLDVAECGEGCIDVFLGLHTGLEVLKDGLFLFKVLSPFLVKGLVVFCALRLELFV